MDGRLFSPPRLTEHQESVPPAQHGGDGAIHVDLGGPALCFHFWWSARRAGDRVLPVLGDVSAGGVLGQWCDGGSAPQGPPQRPQPGLGGISLANHQAGYCLSRVIMASLPVPSPSQSDVVLVDNGDTLDRRLLSVVMHRQRAGAVPAQFTWSVAFWRPEPGDDSSPSISRDAPRAWFDAGLCRSLSSFKPEGLSGVDFPRRLHRLIDGVSSR